MTLPAIVTITLQSAVEQLSTMDERKCLIRDEAPTLQFTGEEVVAIQQQIEKILAGGQTV